MKLLAKAKRILTHALVMPWQVRRAFSKTVCESIAAAIAASEKGNRAEIRFVVEGALDWPQLWRNVDARTRAVNLFSDLRIWDTEHNTGILVYVLFAEKQLEIVADRGISARVPQQEWETICASMTRAFQAGQFPEGSMEGLKRIAALLHQHFPQHSAHNPEEISNQVVIL